MATTQCPRCHYPQSFVVDKSAVEVRQEDIPALRAEVQRLEDVIARLNDDRAVLLRRINDAQDATRNLPPEVLSHIFQFIRPPIDFSTHQIASYRPHTPDSEGDTYDAEEDYHYSLTGVSRRWRQIALSMPHLWTSIAVAANNGSMEFKVSLLNFHFDNARNIPISVELDFRDLEMSPRQDPASRAKCLAHIDPLMTAIFIDRPSHIRNLILIRPPVEWLPLININFSRCDSVTISYPSFGPGWIEQFPSFMLDFTPLPCLQDVHLMDCGVPIILPQTTTSCRLLSSHVSTCLDLLVHYPNLVTFESMEPEALQIPWSYSLMGPMVLPFLEDLTWSNHTADTNDAFVRFLQFIRFARLRTLQWCDDKKHFPFRSLRLDFFSSLPNTLSSLTFNKCLFDSDEIIEELLYCVPQLSELHFIECDPLTVNYAVRVIGRSFPESEDFQGSATIGNRPLGLKVLPNLREMSISDGETLDVYEPGDFIEMFKALLARGITERFFMSFIPGVDWDPDSLAEIRGVLSSGFNAKIDFGCRILE
ncbi:hypothetical protein AGABI1DRAFT_126402 [Agaricus bisporus var. burnettii JB137-S8]|uniref:F-box domain-containing protein n=1 Tax=Agaricus bisporus var. burnettii (strain JB137-S8 / ATCC MYA-4627 / FGSC 10392) TaxID=597362 RepID=K5W5G1_AGABU|nr:uncharacterized protein AGABI1DRAFT_126402 [Agaricus bisporus var. burnettii JB137-S8]EKM82054.1 hypothetical protein AGABI1DRAFT_126402 [Agaricus bisporus var. burnettii JB137-S8]